MEIGVTAWKDLNFWIKTDKRTANNNNFSIFGSKYGESVEAKRNSRKIIGI